MKGYLGYRLTRLDKPAPIGEGNIRPDDSHAARQLRRAATTPVAVW